MDLSLKFVVMLFWIFLGSTSFAEGNISPVQDRAGFLGAQSPGRLVHRILELRRRFEVNVLVYSTRNSAESEREFEAEFQRLYPQSIDGAWVGVILEVGQGKARIQASDLMKEALTENWIRSEEEALNAHLGEGGSALLSWMGRLNERLESFRRERESTAGLVRRSEKGMPWWVLALGLPLAMGAGYALGRSRKRI